MTVHPHVCGELGRKGRKEEVEVGSSPRVWGTGNGFIGFSMFLRFIPTCVGNCEIQRLSPQTAAVHPHVCGELWSVKNVMVIASGSSPRVWGTEDKDYTNW